MCHINNSKIAKKLFAQNKLFKCYKVLKITEASGHYQYSSPYFMHAWKNGINKSNATWDTLPSYVTYIDNGIHVFRTKKAAKNELEYWNRYSKAYAIFPVYGNSSDIIGANEEEIVFSKVRFDRPKQRPKPKK